MKSRSALIGRWTPLFAMTLTSLLGGINANADPGQWIVGTWQLAEDKKNPGMTDDFMDFEANGTVALRTSKKTFANCTYTPGETVVLLKCMAGNKEKTMLMQISSDRKSLVNQLGDVYRKPR